MSYANDLAVLKTTALEQLRQDLEEDVDEGVAGTSAKLFAVRLELVMRASFSTDSVEQLWFQYLYCSYKQSRNIQ